MVTNDDLNKLRDRLAAMASQGEDTGVLAKIIEIGATQTESEPDQATDEQ